MDWLNNPEYRVALIGILGVAVGSLVGLLGTLITTRHTARLAQVAELRRLYADVLGALETEDVFRIRDGFLDKSLEAFYTALGTDEPTAAHLDALAPEEAEDYRRVMALRTKNSEEFTDVISRLLHLGHQTALTAPRDTAEVLSALISASDDRVLASNLHEAFTDFGRRDLAGSLGERLRSSWRVYKRGQEEDFKRLMKDRREFKAGASASG